MNTTLDEFIRDYKELLDEMKPSDELTARVLKHTVGASENTFPDEPQLPYVIHLSLRPKSHADTTDSDRTFGKDATPQKPVAKWRSSKALRLCACLVIILVAFGGALVSLNTANLPSLETATPKTYHASAQGESSGAIADVMEEGSGVVTSFESSGCRVANEETIPILHDWTDDVILGTVVGISKNFTVIPQMGQADFKMFMYEYTVAVDSVIFGDLLKESVQNPSIEMKQEFGRSVLLPQRFIKIRIESPYTNEYSPRLALGKQYLLFLQETYLAYGYNFDTGDGSYFMGDTSDAWQKNDAGEYWNIYADTDLTLEEVTELFSDRTYYEDAADPRATLEREAEQLLQNGTWNQNDYTYWTAQIDDEIIPSIIYSNE